MAFLEKRNRRQNASLSVAAPGILSIVYVVFALILRVDSVLGSKFIKEDKSELVPEESLELFGVSGDPQKRGVLF